MIYLAAFIVISIVIWLIAAYQGWRESTRLDPYTTWE